MHTFTSFLLIISLKFVINFNYDTNFPIIYKDPQSGVNYFGYSLAAYSSNGSDNQKWIKIGAPKGLNDDFESVGVVFNCDLKKGFEGCRKIHLATDSKRHEIANSSWIGSTMDINDQHLVICGFRRHFPRNIDYDTVGGCYWLNLTHIQSNFEDIEPLKSKLLDIPIWNSHYYYSQAQSGFSAHFSQSNDLIIGAPGAYDWSGTIINIKNGVSPNPISSKRKKREIISYIMDVAPQDYDVSSHNDLTGYSVCSGYFYGNNNLIYATGSPKGYHTDRYKGKVLLFRFHKEFKLERIEALMGDQLGEFFGKSLASGKLNNDDYDDLVVGAPYFKHYKFNEGKVVVYLGGKTNMRKMMELKGDVEGGQFGDSLMFLGDIDGDGYGDVAVSAPHSDRTGGTVFIYRGQENGLKETPCQKIFGKSIFQDIQGFGMSFSKPADLDSNGFNDLVIGAPLSGHAVYLRSKPIIVINNEFSSIPPILDGIDSNFTLRACFWYSKFAIPETTLSFEMNILDEKYVEPSLQLHFGKITCRNFKILLKDKYFTVSTLIASLSYKLTQKEIHKNVTLISDKLILNGDDFCKNCPVIDLNRSSRNYTEINIPISLDCGDDNVCLSQMEVEAKIQGINNNTFIIGSSAYLNLLMWVINRGENAYNATIKIFLPNNVQFTELPNQKCYFLNSKSEMLCQVDNPLRNNVTKQLNLNMDMRQISRNIVMDDIVIKYQMSTFSNDTNDGKLYNYTLKLRHADVTIFGLSDQDDYFFGNKTDGILHIIHTYKVTKNGPTPLDKLLVKINIPNILNSNSKTLNVINLHRPFLFFKKRPISCSGDFDFLPSSKTASIAVENKFSFRKKRDLINVKEDFTVKDNGKLGETFYLNCTSQGVVCSSFQCVFGPFESENDVAEIEVEMEVSTLNLTGVMDSCGGLIVSTEGEVVILSPEGFEQSGQSPDKTVVTTIFKKLESKLLPMWIIIISVILGLLLLALIIYILMKVGFFNRTAKEELELRKAEVTKEFLEHEVNNEESLENFEIDSENQQQFEGVEENDACGLLEENREEK